MSRKGEKIGWIGGWFGGFIWLCLLSIAWLIQGKLKIGILGISIFIIAILFIFIFAPWKFPRTKYWKLMLPIYAVFFTSIILSIYLLGGLKSVGLNWFSFFWIIPCLIPFVTVGNRSWKNRDISDDLWNNA